MKCPMVLGRGGACIVANFANGRRAPRGRSRTAEPIRKRFRFEAAHVLPHHPGKCSRPHGHSFRSAVAVEGPLHATGPAQGMVIDFDEIAAIVKPAVVERLSQESLNEVMPHHTAEHMWLLIWDDL